LAIGALHEDEAPGTLFLDPAAAEFSPDDGRFEMLIEAPFRAPEKKKTNGPRF